MNDSFYINLGKSSIVICNGRNNGALNQVLSESLDPFKIFVVVVYDVVAEPFGKQEFLFVR
jgi:hypothetical protein